MLRNADDSVFAHALDEGTDLVCIRRVVSPGASAFFHERVGVTVVLGRVEYGRKVHVDLDFFERLSDFVR